MGCWRSADEEAYIVGRTKQSNGLSQPSYCRIRKHSSRVPYDGSAEIFFATVSFFASSSVQIKNEHVGVICLLVGEKVRGTALTIMEQIRGELLPSRGLVCVRR